MKSFLGGVIFISLSFVMSCSSRPQGDTKSNTKLKCGEKKESHSILSRHVALYASSQKKRLARCFKNFLQFEVNKTQTIHVCNKLNVARSGKVTYAKVNGVKLSKDFKMCLEQELWTMNFSAIQPDKNVSVSFPITFRSK